MAIRQTNFTKTTFYLALALAISNGCRKDVELFIEHPATNLKVSETLEKLVQNDAMPTFFDIKNAGPNALFIAPNGLRLVLDESSDALFADESTGAEVTCSACAEAKIELLTAFSKGQMLGNRLSSVAGNQVSLDLFGAVRLRATCDGKAMKLRDGKKIRLQAPFSAAFQTPHQLFFGEKNAKNQPFWAASDNAEGVLAANWLANNESETGYEWQINRLGWAAAAKAATNVSGLVCVKLKEPETPQNALVFAVFKNQNSIVEFSQTSQPYQMCASAIPNGAEIEIIVVSKQDGKWRLGRLETTAETGREIDLGGILDETDEAAIADFLKNL